jgi:hypothetical protein
MTPALVPNLAVALVFAMMLQTMNDSNDGPRLIDISTLFAIELDKV